MTRVFLLMACLAPNIAFAAPVVYVCNVDTNRSSAFQRQFVIAYDAAAGFVSVSDALIQGVTGGPILGEVASENTTRVVFKWTLRNVSNGSGQQASLAYRATVFKADGLLDVSMRPLNFDNSFSARGTCRIE